MKEILCFFVSTALSLDCFRLMMMGILLDPLLEGLPVSRQPKEGAVDSTFNEQSQTLSPASAGTVCCSLDRASVELIMWFTLSQRLGFCCAGAENSTMFVVITVWHGEVRLRMTAFIFVCEIYFFLHFPSRRSCYDEAFEQGMKPV